MKLYQGYDDYELLYLISESNEKALEALIKKYQPLIIKTIDKLNFDRRFFEDYIQEGNLILLNAIRTYKDSYGKSFCKYFELILLRELCRIINQDRKKNSYLLVEDFPNTVKSSIKEEPFLYNLPAIELKTDIEKTVFQKYFLEGYNISYLEGKYHLKPKQIYNAIARIKKKIQDKCGKY